MMHQKRSRKSVKIDRQNLAIKSLAGGRQEQQQQKSLLFAFLLTLVIIIQLLDESKQVYSLSLISEKCDPNKVGPDETTVKGGWQAEMFNGLSFRACGE